MTALRQKLRLLMEYERPVIAQPTRRDLNRDKNSYWWQVCAGQQVMSQEVELSLKQLLDDNDSNVTGFVNVYGLCSTGQKQAWKKQIKMRECFFLQNEFDHHYFAFHSLSIVWKFRQHQGNKSWESYQGLLGEKLECYFLAMPSLLNES